jgi:hypothetical protein
MRVIPPGNSKYRAKGRRIDGHWLASGAEAKRYEQLREMLELGTISQLELQPRYPCNVGGLLVCTYVADFRYRTMPGQMGSRVMVEDVKGLTTALYRIKKKLMAALHPGVVINELKVPRTGSMERFRFLTADQIGVPEKGDRQTHVKVSARKTGRT